MDYIALLEVIENTSGSNAKKDLLSQHCGKDLLSILKKVYDNTFNFNIFKLPDISDCVRLNENTNSQILVKFEELAKRLSAREITGNEAKEAVRQFLLDTDPVQEKWFRRIFKKNLRISIGTKTINSALGYEAIPEFKIMKAQKIKNLEEMMREGKSVKKITYPIMSDYKYDGFRCLIPLWSMTPLSSNGKEFKNWTVITDELKNALLNEDYLLDGEIVYSGDDDDYEGVMKNAFTKHREPPQDIEFKIFAILTRKEWEEQYSDKNVFDVIGKRFVKSVNPEKLNKVKVGKRTIVNNHEEALLHFENAVADGQEGTILKKNEPYEFKRSFSWIKIKPTETIDVEVIDVIEGEGKYEGSLGAMVFKYGERELHVGIGCDGSLTDGVRQQIWDDREDVVGRVIEVKMDKETGKGGTRFPRFVRFRDDKDIDDVDNG